MLAEDRLNAIVSMVQQAGSVTVPELADALGVTASTIRRDLQTLDRAHRIAKVHGGATSLERAHVTRDLTISERSDLHNDDKERICARAAALVEPDSFVYIDSGSTTLKLIEHLPHLEGVTYVTDSVLHAQHLALRGMRTVVLGGELKPETEALVGPDALATLERYNFNCGFWGSNGIAARARFYDSRYRGSAGQAYLDAPYGQTLRNLGRQQIWHGGARQVRGLPRRNNYYRGRSARQVPGNGQRHHGLAAGQGQNHLVLSIEKRQRSLRALPLSLSAGLSKSVTTRPLKVGQVLQIEILTNRAVPLSRSVTSGADFAELLLQIEIFP